MQSAVQPNTLLPGNAIDEYVIQHVIGDGGFSTVYRAHDTQLDRLVAVKQFRSEAFAGNSARDWFRREAQLTASLRHPNIVQIYSMREAFGSMFLVMEYLPADLLQIVRDHGHLENNKLLQVASDMCRALDTLHARNIIHRDIKPENILLAQADRDQFKLADFGLAHVHPTQRYGHNDAIGPQPGTLLYMSPEQALGNRVTPRSDIYSLAVVLYEALTGHYYLDFDEDQHDDNDLIDLITNANPLPILPNGSSNRVELEQPLLRALSKDPAERPANARAFLVDLKNAASRSKRSTLSRRYRTLSGESAVASPELLGELYAVRTLREAEDQPLAAHARMRAVWEMWRAVPEVGAEWGETLVALGQVDEGRRWLEMAVRQKTELPYAQLALASLYRDLDDDDEAADDALVQAIEIDPDLVYAVLYPDIVDSLDDAARFDEYVELFGRAVTDRRSPQVLHVLGQVLALSPQRERESIAAFEAAIREDAEYGPAYVGLASLLIEAGNVDRALDLLEQSTYVWFPTLPPDEWQKSEMVYQRQHAFLALAVTQAEIGAIEASADAALRVLEIDGRELEEDITSLLDAYVVAAKTWINQGNVLQTYHFLSHIAPLASYWGYLPVFGLMEATERQVKPEERSTYPWETALDWLSTGLLHASNPRTNSSRR